jgi:hypothetical protein
MAPSFIIAICVQAASFCKDGEEYVKIEGEQQSCSEFRSIRIYRAMIVLVLIIFAHYVQQFMVNI